MKRPFYNIQILFSILNIIFQVPVYSCALVPDIVFQQDTVSKLQSTFIQPVYTTQRLSAPRPVIDGKLNDKCWKNGIWAGDYHQFTPNEGARPAYPTEINIQYDDKNLYVAFRAYDGEPKKSSD